MPSAPALTGTIGRIDRGAVHDGPGLRTVVFFKGCPLRCSWCHSPESQGSRPEVLIRADRCLACDACVTACVAGAAMRQDVDRTRCTRCGRCIEVCVAGARELVGTPMTVEDVMTVVRRDRAFYDASGGGVTLSGGEPLAQPAFALSFLGRCRRERMHTAIETCGHVRTDVLVEAAAIADLILFDVKLADDLRHRNATGASNRRIVANLRTLAAHRADIVVRLPLVPGVNDDRDNLAATGTMVRALGIRRLDLLPYHRAGVAKYERLGRPYALDGVAAASDDAAASAARVLRQSGLDVSVGGRP